VKQPHSASSQGECDVSRPSGRIELICGSMWSSKSTTMLARMRRYSAAKLRCVVLRYSNDTRYSDTKFSTHDKEMVDAISVSSLDESEVPDSMFLDKDVILVDEGQFLRSLVDFCERHANQGRIVVVAALDSDADRNPFGEVCNLIPKAELVTKLSAVCMVCHTADAPFTKRLVDSKAIELIGGADKYQARCRGCWDAPIPDHMTEIHANASEKKPMFDEVPPSVEVHKAPIPQAFDAAASNTAQFLFRTSFESPVMCMSNSDLSDDNTAQFLLRTSFDSAGSQNDSWV
jgi:thymidine kinase